MSATKVLVVDDSLTMRVLISGALERIPNVDVVGLADGAEEARTLTARLHPDVMTLDVEMPGMNGIDYLAEIMANRPMPVIMFSSRTEAGAEASVEALRLGAIDCFPKPRVATPVELDKIIAKLGKRIKAAKGMALTRMVPETAKGGAALDWNGRLLAIGGDASSTKALFDLFATFPANCPPTLVVQHLDAALADSMVRKLDARIAPRVVLAEDGKAVEQGHIYFAPPGDRHMVLDGWPEGRLRLLARDPVAGERPSISLMFASVARAAARQVVGVLLAPGNEDGGAGMKALLAADGHGLSPAAPGTAGFVLSYKMMSQPVTADDFVRMALKLCSK